ncbi:MAG: FAD:protein FMN transferase, partial [Candidatus Omnitrophota bacterium]|nr:FAD:protein FMN transferase [Candidatus Omnitrophota bacterium]
MKRSRLTIAAIVLLLSGCLQQPLHRDTRVLMGTFVEVVSTDARAQKIAFDEIKRIEDLLSKYRPESEVSRLNRAGKLKVSAETFALLKTCKEFSAATDGAFDVSVGALVDLWGFTDKKFRVPSEQEIAAALAKVGSDKIVLNESDSTVEFSTPGLKIDLGGVAKGYAVDRAIEKIKQAGIDNCLI